MRRRKIKLNIEAVYWEFAKEDKYGDIEDGTAFAISHAGERGEAMYLFGTSIDQTNQIVDEVMNQIADGMLHEPVGSVAPLSLSGAADDEPDEIVIRIRKLARAPFLERRAS